MDRARGKSLDENKKSPEEKGETAMHWYFWPFVIYFILGIIVALRETYWDFGAPIFDAAFFWVVVRIRDEGKEGGVRCCRL